MFLFLKVSRQLTDSAEVQTVFWFSTAYIKPPAQRKSTFHKCLTAQHHMRIAFIYGKEEWTTLAKKNSQMQTCQVIQARSSDTMNVE